MRKYVSKRTYEVVESFTMGGVEATAIWTFEVADDSDDIDASVTVATECVTADAVRESGHTSAIDTDDVPRNIMEKLEEIVRCDVDVIRDEQD